jgi:hypothetical protein
MDYNQSFYFILFNLMRSFITCTSLAKHNYNHEVKEDNIGMACSTNGAKRNVYRMLVGKSEGKRPLRRPRCRWVDNIKMDLREIEWDGMDWIALAQDRDQLTALVNTVMNLRVP